MLNIHKKCMKDFLKTDNNTSVITKNNKNTSQEEAEIVHMVYELSGLTAEEINVNYHGFTIS